MRAIALPLDVGDSASFPVFAVLVCECLATLWQRERIDYLVNNAGVGVHAPFADTATFTVSPELAVGATPNDVL